MTRGFFSRALIRQALVASLLALTTASCGGHGSLACDVLVFDEAERGSFAELSPGEVRSEQLVAHDLGRVLVQFRWLSDSTEITTVPVYLAFRSSGATAWATANEALYAENRYWATQILEQRAGVYELRSHCPNCFPLQHEHTLRAGHIDTVTVYVGRARNQCERPRR